MNQRFLIIAADFYRDLTDALVGGAAGVFKEKELDFDEVRVPGSFELPIVAAKAARSRRYSGVLCLGVVIKGETPHFDYVCNEAARGIMNISLETEVPIIFGVLTTNNRAQAEERCGLRGERGNKGTDGAQAAIQMVEVLKGLSVG